VRPRSRSCRSPRSFEMAHSLRRRGPSLSHPSPRRPAPTRSSQADALVVKVRAAGRTVNVHVLVVTEVNALGPPERSSASRSPPAKDKAGWLACWRLLMARGLLRGGARDLEMRTRGSSMRSARPGSPGSACRTHDLAGSLCQGGGVASSPCVATLVRTIFDALGRHRGHSLSSNGSPRRWPGSCLKAAWHLEQARCDLLAFRHFR